MAAMRSPEYKPSESGFRAQLREANLADLVQMECLSQSRRAIRITTQGDIGYLFFSGGAIVHASTLETDGEEAALEILKWNHGTFEPCEREIPALATISVSAQHLLLRAAQATDEEASGKVVQLPPKGRGALETPLHFTEHDTMRPAAFVDAPNQKEEPVLVLRIDAHGSVLANTGASEEYAQMVAYACLLADIVGTHLGMDELCAMECIGPSGKTIIYRDADDQIVAVKPSTPESLAELRERIGL